MGYHKRGLQSYYYQKEWRDGRCVCVYMGKGEEAEAAHAAMQERLAEREETNRQLLELETMNRWAEDLVDLEFLANGYHKPYGVWRRRNRRTLTPEVQRNVRMFGVAMEEVKARIRVARPDLELAVCGVHPVVLRSMAARCRTPWRKSMLLAQLAARARCQPFADRTNYAEKINPGAILGSATGGGDASCPASAEPDPMTNREKSRRNCPTPEPAGGGPPSELQDAVSRGVAKTGP